MIKLTDAQRNELGRLAGIPHPERIRFAEAVGGCVRSYLRTLQQKPPAAVESELKQVEQRVESCLRLACHKKWRPGKFREGIKAVSGALKSLSAPAKQFLALRNARVVHAIPAEWSPTVISDVVTDPICFSDFDDQLAALEDLLGALAGPVAKKKQGRPRKYAERALRHYLALTFTRFTDKPAGGSNSFLNVCNKIKLIYQLGNWKPDSLPRSIRTDRAGDG
jgi:hypothetical protein